MKIKIDFLKGGIGWRLGIMLLLTLTLLTLTLLIPGQTLAQNNLVGSWQASYWNNVALSGRPDLVRSESAVDDNWRRGAPDQAIMTDRFSARFEGILDLLAGQYRFTVTADDGVRVWVNGRRIIDEWHVQPAKTFTADFVTAGGNTPVTVEYFENTGLAQIAFSWERLDSFAGRWQGEYFNNRTLTGSPALVRPDPAVNFNWGAGSPSPDVIDPEAFSVRWTRSLDLPAGQYRFTLTVDDGARLWVNNNLLIDAWHIQGITTYEREVTLSRNIVPIRLEYFENGGLAVAQLSWTRIHALPNPGSGALIDNGGAGFVSGGPAVDWHSENEGFNNSLLWSRNSADAVADYNWARWYPALTSGRYEVEVYIPFRFSTTAQARYWISHADGYTQRTIDQSAGGDRWASLGTYYFEGTGSDFVSLADVTFEADGSRLVAFDAVRWTPVSGE